MVKLKLKEGAKIPEYATKGSSGVDVVAYDILAIYKGFVKSEDNTIEAIREKFLSDKEGEGAMFIRPQERVLIDTGLSQAEIPENSEIQVRPRSGISLKKGLLVANAPGTLDEDYRGNIGVILFNPSNFIIKIERFERIAQLVLCPILRTEWTAVEEINFNTERGAKGFGSTGTK